MRDVSQPICRSLAVLSLVMAAVALTLAVPLPALAVRSATAKASPLCTPVVLAGPEGGAARAYSTAFSPDGRLAAAGTNDGVIHLFDGRTGKALRTLVCGSTVEAMAFSPDSRLLAGAANNHVSVWDTTSRAKRWEVIGGQGEATRLLLETSVAFTPDGQTVVVAGQKDMTREAMAGIVVLLDARTGRLEKTLVAHGEPVNGVAVSPDGRHIAGVTGAFESEHPEVFVWDRSSGAEVWVGRADAGPLFVAAFSPDSRTLAVGGRSPDGATVGLWDAESGALKQTLPHGDSALAVAFSPDGRTLATGGLNGSLRLWDTSNGALRKSLPGAHAPLSVLSIAFAPDGHRFLVASDEGTVRMWKAED